MKKNIGTIDRIIRIAIAALIGVLYAAGQITGTAALLLGLLAAVFVLTGLASVCPLYLPFGFSTRRDARA
jgi:hypothetical protein